MWSFCGVTAIDSLRLSTDTWCIEPSGFLSSPYGYCVLQIIVLMALLSRLLTWQSAVSGLAVTLSIIPLSIFVGRWQTRIRSHVVQRTDARVKLTGEVLSGKSDCHVMLSSIALQVDYNVHSQK